MGGLTGGLVGHPILVFSGIVRIRASKQLAEPVVLEDRVGIKPLCDAAEFLELWIQFFGFLLIEWIVLAPMASSAEQLCEHVANKIGKSEKPLSLTRPMKADQADRIPILVRLVAGAGHRNQRRVAQNTSHADRIMMNVRSAMLFQFLPAIASRQ